MKRQFILGILLIFLSVITVNAQQKLSNQELNQLEQQGRKGSIKAYQKLADYFKQKGNINSANKYLLKIKDLKKIRKRKQDKMRGLTKVRKNNVIQGLYMAGATGSNPSEKYKFKNEAYNFVKNTPLQNVYGLDTPNSIKHTIIKVYINKYTDEYYLFYLDDLYASNPYRSEYTCFTIIKVTKDQIIINKAKEGWEIKKYSRASRIHKSAYNLKNIPNGY